MTSTLALASLLGAASLVTSFISGILGMAGGMMLLGILLAVVPVPVAMMLHGMTQFASNGGRAWMLRHAIHRRVFAGYALGAAVAAGAFAAAGIVLSKPHALIAMGLTPFVGLALPRSLHLNVERRGHAFACGLICVALSLTAGVAGPLLDLFYVRSRMSRHAVVATKAATQTLSHLIKIAYFGGLATTASLETEPLYAVPMVVLALIGTSLSRHVLERMTDASFRQWTRRTVMTLGVAYLAWGVAALAR